MLVPHARTRRGTRHPDPGYFSALKNNRILVISPRDRNYRDPGSFRDTQKLGIEQARGSVDRSSAICAVH